MKKFDYIIYDGNNLYSKNFFIHHKESLINVRNTIIANKVIEGFLQSISIIEKKYLKENGIIYYCFDNHTSEENYRSIISDEYKKTRVSKPQYFYEALDYLQIILQYRQNNSFLVYKSLYEADDYVYNLIQIILNKNKYANILLISDDLDWCKTIDFNVEVLRKNHKLKEYQLYTRDVFFNEYNFFPEYEKLIIYKIFNGDNSDNIKVAVPYLSKKTILKIINNYNYLKDFIDDFENDKISFLVEKEKKIIKENKQKIITNYQLINYINIHDEELQKYIFPCERKEKTLIILYEAVQLNFQKINETNLNNQGNANSFFDFQNIKRI